MSPGSIPLVAGRLGYGSPRRPGHSTDPFFPLAVALPRMLERVGVELPMAGPAEARRLRQRAQMILDLLTPTQSPVPT
jgi:hypothetical protein